MIADTAIVYPGTVVPEDCTILDYAVVGKQRIFRTDEMSADRVAVARDAMDLAADSPPLALGPGRVV